MSLPEQFTDNVVTKSNALIEASYKLKAIEQKIIIYLASRIHPDDDDFHTYTLSIREFHRILDLKGSAKYTEMRKITKNMMKKVFEVRIENKVIQANWLSYVAYNEQEGTIDIRFDPFLKPYLLHLKKEFTSYRLKNIIQLKSAYSIRIYELLKQYERLKERTISVQQLREYIGATDTYPRYGNFKQRILKQAQKELEAYTDISFDIVELKKGRKVDKLKFIIKKQRKQYQLPPGNISLPRSRKKAKSLGLDIPEHLWSEWENKHEDAHILACLDTLSQQDNIHNPIGFLQYLLQQEPLSLSAATSEKAHRAWREVREIIQKMKRSDGVLPGWLIVDTLRDTLSKHLTDEETEEWLDTYKEEWMKEIKS